MDDDLIAAYFDENVLIPYHQFFKQSKANDIGRGKDIRLARSSALALYHFRERLQNTRCSVGYKDILSQCDDYGIVRDIANLAKHRIPLRDSTTHVVNAENHMYDVLNITVYKDEFGNYRDFTKKTYVVSINYGEQELLPALTNVLNFWIRYLKTSGLKYLDKEVKIKTRKEPLERFQCNKYPPKLMLKQGIRADFDCRLRAYNYEQDVVETVDLTGYEATMPIYSAENAPVIELFLSSPATEKMFSETVLLDPNDVMKLRDLKSDGDKSRYLSSLPKVKEAFGWLSAQLRKEEKKLDTKSHTNE